MLLSRSRSPRIAWLLTHSSLRSAEVPVLRSLGCEVWTQKAFPPGPSYRSCSADFHSDHGLSLPPDALNALNAFDFYTYPIPSDIADLLNRHFDLVIIDPFPLKTREILAKFQGPVLARAFGLERPHSYSDQYFDEDWPDLTTLMRQHYGRFWFSTFYPEVIPHEVTLLQQRAFHLPITLPEAAWQRQNTWQGGDSRLFFVCSSINDHPAARAVYDQFKHHFGDLPHIIVGRQDHPVNDPCVAGFLPHAEYDHLYRRVQVMYYHSREPRHLHYHPIEAMASGMPVVYLRGGLLEGYDTGSQAGACHDESEARQKLQAILAGDHALIDAIRESQRTVVDQWRPEVARLVWQQWLTLLTPDADGKVPAYELWPQSPPCPRQDELRRFPYLDPTYRPLFPFLHRVCSFTRRYLNEAFRQRTLLPRGLRRTEQLRWVLDRLWGGKPSTNKAA